MAKHAITRRCGHTETVNICGPYKDRDRQAEYQATRLCGDCYKAAKAAETAAVEDAERELLAGIDLPTLTGSDKQIAWAQDIRRAQLLELARYGAGTAGGSGDNPEHVRKIVEHIAPQLAACDWAGSAKWWIDHRNIGPRDLAAAIAG